MTNSDTLVIPRVDFDLLEAQRQELNSLLDRDQEMGFEFLTENERGALEGVTMMLDWWSDSRAEWEDEVTRLREKVKRLQHRINWNRVRGDGPDFDPDLDEV